MVPVHNVEIDMGKMSFDRPAGFKPTKPEPEPKPKAKKKPGPKAKAKTPAKEGKDE